MVRAIWCEQALLATGWGRHVRLELKDGLIARIETGQPPKGGDARVAVALPGLCNLHSHAFQRGMAGLAEVAGGAGDSFWTWREVMYRFLDQLTPDDVEAIASLAYAEMLEAGFTRVGEFHYLHHAADGRPYADIAELAGRIAAAADHTGIGLTLLPVFYAHGGFGAAPAGPAQRRFVNTLDQFSSLAQACRSNLRTLPDANMGVAPHSLRAVSPEQLAQLIPMAKGGPVHIHIAEQVKEVLECQAWSGQRPVEWLLDHAPVNARWTLVHATHITKTETKRLAATGAVAGLTPITEANLGDGLFPAQRYLAAGGMLGVGSDSNVLIDAAEELRLLEYGQRLADKSRNVLASDARRSTGARLFSAALAGGRRALDQESGGLDVGASADLIGLKPDHPSLVGRVEDLLLDGWIFAAPRAIDQVWRRGKLVVEEGRHLAKEAITRRYNQTLKRLLDQ